MQRHVKDYFIIAEQQIVPLGRRENAYFDLIMGALADFFWCWNSGDMIIE